MKHLSEEALATLGDLLVRHLREAELAAPRRLELEPAFTGRVLLPAVRSALNDLDITGFVLSGDGGAAARPIRFLNSSFHPDIAVHYYGQRAFACEVKLLRGGHLQGLTATALGQSLVYRAGGFPTAATFLVDVSDRVSVDAVTEAARVVPHHGTRLIVRKVRQGELEAHPA